MPFAKSRLIVDNLEVELAPFSFKLPNGGEGFMGLLMGTHQASLVR